MMGLHAAAPDLADVLDASPLARRSADRIRRCANDLAVTDGDWPLSAAALVLGDPEVRAALDAVKALTARHQPVRLAADSDVVVCSCSGRIAFAACEDARLLGLTP